MSDSIDYYFTLISPFTWFGQKQLSEIAKKHDKKINYKPFNLMGVWEISEAVPPGARPPVRQRYRLIELERVASFHGLSVIKQPTNFPTNPELADRCAIAIEEAGGDAGGFAFSVGEALWAHDRQVADEAVIGELLSANGFVAKDILKAAADPKTADIRAANTKAAIEADAIGAPAYVYSGEVFWGQDRLDHLDHMISTGREAFTA